MRRCTRCYHELPEAAFRRQAMNATTPRSRLDASRRDRRTICIPCEQEMRDARKQENRWRRKAQDTRRGHAAKLGIPAHVLANTYGWTDERLARDMQGHDLCCYCELPFSEMPNGMADITVDIHDRDQVPEYKTNTRIICITCNRLKGTLSPADFAAVQLAYRIRAGATTGLTEQTPRQLTLQLS
jgi:hypothetical protein